MRKLSLAILLIAAGAMAVVTTGCRTVKKTASTQESKSESSQKTTVDSTVEKKESVAVTVSEGGSSKKSEKETATDGISIKFETTDTAKKIWIHAADYFAPGSRGSITLPGSATSLDIYGTRSKETVDSSAWFAMHSRIEALEDSLSMQRTDTGSRKADITTTATATEKRASWIGGAWALAITAGAMLIFYFFVWRRKRKR